MSQYEKKVQKAAALKYSDFSGSAAPVVVASGLGSVAQQIVDIAGRNNVPVFRDDSLATLLSQLRAGVEIPPELYRAVIDIYIYFLGFSVDSSGSITRSRPPEENSSSGQDSR